MKKVIVIFALGFAALPACSQKSASRTPESIITGAENTSDSTTEYKGLRLVWADEFNGNNLDTVSWNRCPQGIKQWSRHMSPADTVCRIGSGTLQLFGLRTPAELNDPRPCITGGVNSKGKRSIRLGRIDVRARVVGGKGFWPAIWLVPDSNIAWPRGGEIDIMEHLNHDSEVHQTVHTYRTWKGWEKPAINHATTPVEPSEFNVYSVEISQDKIDFFVNGKKTHTYPRMKPEVENQFPFPNNPFYLILSAQLGGDWVGEIGLEELPVVMEIDYVRFYEWE